MDRRLANPDATTLSKKRIRQMRSMQPNRLRASEQGKEVCVASGEPVLKASFVRTVGERDRIYVVRSNGTEVNWAFPTYGDALPHDLIHLVVEAAFGLAQGFWGRVDAGADPAAIMAEANRRGGSNKYSGFGSDRSQLQLAEVLANAGWLVGEPSAAVLYERIVAACRESGLAVPELLSEERIHRVCAVLKRLSSGWRGLIQKGALQLEFDPGRPHI